MRARLHRRPDRPRAGPGRRRPAPCPPTTRLPVPTFDPRTIRNTMTEPHLRLDRLAPHEYRALFTVLQTNVVAKPPDVIKALREQRRQTLRRQEASLAKERGRLHPHTNSTTRRKPA